MTYKSKPASVAGIIKRRVRMNTDEMKRAISEAEITLRCADNVSTDMAQLLVGRLRRVKWCKTLKALKRELMDYNAVTGCWREDV
jgi:hypothetical protein